MQKSGDVYMIFAIVVLIAIWGWFRFRRWLYAPMSNRLPFPSGDGVSAEEVVDILQQEGYEVVSGKQRVPIRIAIDGKSLQTRYFIDCFAKKQNELYVVKLARSRHPVEWTGSGVRDRLLPYAMLFSGTSGILYVDIEAKTLKRIKISILTDEPAK